MKPNELRNQLEAIVAKACKCEAAWTQHPGPVTQNEAIIIRREVALLLERVAIEATEREIDARYRLKVGGLTR